MDPPVAFGSANNRLMMEIVERIAPVIIEEQSSSGGGFGSLTDPTLGSLSSGGTQSLVIPQEIRTLLATKWYYYNDNGNVTRVVTNPADTFGVPTTAHTADRMGYAFNQQTVAYAIGETWTWDGTTLSNYATTHASQFRYDGARARYLVRTLDPANPWSGSSVTVLSDTWTDYDGDQPYGDFTVSGAVPNVVVTNVRSHNLAMGGFDWSGGLPDDTTATYAHRDMIGTMRMTSTAGGSILGGPIFTAFGELRLGPDTRFGYAGAHGYQTDTTSGFPFLHLGARYYDPQSGRFLQRDPIGIRDGTNVYAYVRNRPINSVDPSGLNGVGDFLIGASGAIGGLAGIIFFAPLPGGRPSAGAVGAFAAIVCSVGTLINAVTDDPPIKVIPIPPNNRPMPPPTIGGGFIIIDPSKGT